ncbi:LDH2 family malate/lactate/ureidoglycolate dehydrogenase [Bradyrhizobium sp. LB9.1b]
MVTIQVQNLIDFVGEVFGHAESSPEEARRIATYLTTANLTGHDSHGVIRVPVYIRWKKTGFVVPNQNAEIVLDTPSLAVVDGKFGYGQTVTPQAVRIGIEKCKRAGLAAVALRNAGHIGRVGDWAEMAAAEGLISVHFVNAAGSLLVAPFGGVEKRLSTAPYCVGIPREGQDPIVLDFATSVVAEGKVLVASRGGKKLPKGALVDADGSLSEDPAVLYGPYMPEGPRDHTKGTGGDPRLRRAQGLGACLHVRAARRRADRNRCHFRRSPLRQRHAGVLRRSESGRYLPCLRRRGVALCRVHPRHQAGRRGRSGPDSR